MSLKYIKKILRISDTNNAEHGAALLTTLIILVLLTIIGVSGINMAITDLQITRNYKVHQKNLYMAEAAANEAVEQIYQIIVENKHSGNWLQDIERYDSLEELDWTENYNNSTISSSCLYCQANYKAFSNKTGSINKYKVFGLGQYEGKAIVEFQISINSTHNIVNTKSALGVYTSNSSINGTGNGMVSGENYDPPANFDCTNCYGKENSTVNGTNPLYMEYNSSNFTPSGNFDMESDSSHEDIMFGNNNASNNNRWIDLANSLYSNLNSSSEVVKYQNDNTLGNRKDPKVTFIENDQSLSASDDGAGLLIIKNKANFDVAGDFHFEGLVVKIDHESNNTEDDVFLSGNTDIFGSVIIAGSGTTEIFNTGDANIKYSRIALINALDKIDVLDIIELNYWRERFF